MADSTQPGDDDTGKDPTTSTTTIVYDLLSFALIIACDIVPCMILIDSQFIKILTFDAFRQYEIDIVLKKEQENAKIIEGQQNHMLDIRRTDFSIKSSSQGQLKLELD